MHRWSKMSAEVTEAAGSAANQAHVAKEADDDDYVDKRSKWFQLDKYGHKLPVLTAPDRELYLLNTETNQLDHIVKLAQFSNHQLFFLGNNLLSLSFDSSQGAKVQVHRLPDLKLLYQFPCGKSWLFLDERYFLDNHKTHYFYYLDSKVLHRVSTAGKTDLQILIKDLAIDY